MAIFHTQAPPGKLLQQESSKKHASANKKLQPRNQFLKATCKPLKTRTYVLQQMWEVYDPNRSDAEFTSWLPSFFEDFLTAVAAELKWAASHIPEQYPEAVLHLLTAFFSRISKSFRSRIETALSSGTQ